LEYFEINVRRENTDFKIGSDQRWTSKQSREHHVDGDLHHGGYIPIPYLNILYLGGFPGVPLGAAARLHPDQLQLDRPDGHGALLQLHAPGERLADAATSAVQLPRQHEIGRT
jgi:hypothetical protein